MSSLFYLTGLDDGCLGLESLLYEGFDGLVKAMILFLMVQEIMIMMGIVSKFRIGKLCPAFRQKLFVSKYGVLN